jgi:hypothetical protein
MHLVGFITRKVPYHIQWSSPLVAVLNHISPVDTLSSFVLKIQYIILLFMPSSYRWLLSGFLTKILHSFLSSPIHATHPVCLILDLIN